MVRRGHFLWQFCFAVIGLTVALLSPARVVAQSSTNVPVLVPSDGPLPTPHEERVALAVGMSHYQHISPLENPKNDAQLMAETLKKLGFALVGDKAQIDLNRQQLEEAIRTFGRNSAGADVALFYYAGHAVQAEGTNWLAPVTANPNSLADLDFEMIPLDLMLRQMEEWKPKLKIVVLDACRNNPFKFAGYRAATGGLAEPKNVPLGMLISYATAPGSVAQDGTGGHSPYTRALARAMTTPGMDVFAVFNEVQVQVAHATADEQQPWISHSPIDGDFFFIPIPPGSTVTIQTPPLGSTPAPAVDKEALFWESIKDSKDSADFEAYLKRYPRGDFAALARNRLKSLQVAQPEPAAPMRLPQVAAITPPPRLSPPVGRWLGNGSAAEANRAHDGALQGDVTFSQGRTSTSLAFSFGPAGGLVRAEATGFPIGASSRTLAAWIKMDEVPPSNAEAFFAGYGGFGHMGQSYALGFSSSANRLFFSNWGQALFSSAPIDRSWHFVAVVTEQSDTGSPVSILYMDGAEVARGNLLLATAPGSQFFIGGLPGDPSRRIHGQIQDVVIYDRALSPSELRALAQR